MSQHSAALVQYIPCVSIMYIVTVNVSVYMVCVTNISVTFVEVYIHSITSTNVTLYLVTHTMYTDTFTVTMYMIDTQGMYCIKVALCIICTQSLSYGLDSECCYTFFDLLVNFCCC